jgi:hypothetical protein
MQMKKWIKTTIYTITASGIAFGALAPTNVHAFNGHSPSIQQHVKKENQQTEADRYVARTAEQIYSTWDQLDKIWPKVNPHVTCHQWHVE